MQANLNILLTSFQNGKLRKNSRKKIQSLLDACTTLTLKTQSMQIDDSWESNEPVSLNKDEFWEWFNNNYSDMSIWLDVQNGVLLKATFRECVYYFADKIVMTFTLDKQEKKPKAKLTFNQVKKALEEGYLSPLNSDNKSPTPPKNSRKIVSLGDYQNRLENKKERFEIRAEKAQRESMSHYKRAHDLGQAIPFGQPILVGHHSEKRHRRYLEVINTNMRKSVEAEKKAVFLEKKANNAGRTGIASDDPDAISKLKAKLDGLVRCQELMKSVNKVVKSHHMSDSDKIEYMTREHDITEKKARDLINGDDCGRVGFAPYALQNNNATIRQTKERIADLESLHNSEPLENSGSIEGIEWTLYEEDGRIKFKFDTEPSDEVKKLLSSNGFRWSRYSTAWVRKLTSNAVSSARSLVTTLNSKLV